MSFLEELSPIFDVFIQRVTSFRKSSQSRTTLDVLQQL